MSVHFWALLETPWDPILMTLTVTLIPRYISTSRASQNHCSTLPICLHSCSGLTKILGVHTPYSASTLIIISLQNKPYGTNIRSWGQTLLWKILYRGRDLRTIKTYLQISKLLFTCPLKFDPVHGTRTVLSPLLRLPLDEENHYSDKCGCHQVLVLPVSLLQ